MKNVSKKFRHRAISAYYSATNPFRRMYWFIVRPERRGAKGVIFWNDRVLLVRLSYGHKRWALPDGGVEREESFRDAAIREVKEEVGIAVSEAEFFYEYHTSLQYRKNTTQCFAMKVSSPEFTIDEQEIAEAGWFPPGGLPENVVPSVKEVLMKYSEWKQTHV